MKILDFRGKECPEPLVKTIREISKIQKGEVLIILTTSKMCVDMIKESIDAFGIASINVTKTSDYYEIKLVKTVEF